MSNLGRYIPKTQGQYMPKVAKSGGTIGLPYYGTVPQVVEPWFNIFSTF